MIELIVNEDGSILVPNDDPSMILHLFDEHKEDLDLFLSINNSELLLGDITLCG
jgi:hypothetical protein